MFSHHTPLLRPAGDDSRKGPYVEVILRVIDGPKEKDRTFKLDGLTQSITVGRASTRNLLNETPLHNNCYIESPILSRKHAHFVIGEKSHPLWLIDDGSTHGTYIDEVKLIPGNKTYVEDGAIIRFGQRVITGTIKYLPTMFQASFIWHTPAMAEPFRSFMSHPKLGIQAPTPSSDSEDEDEEISDVETPLPTTGFPLADAINSSNYIDLTDEPESEERHESDSEDQEVQSMSKQHESRTISLTRDGSENADSSTEDPAITTSPAKRSWRFVYDDSDPEEDDAEATSQGSPRRDYDSLYDNSDESDAPLSPQLSPRQSTPYKPRAPTPFEPLEPMMLEGEVANTQSGAQGKDKDEVHNQNFSQLNHEANSLDPEYQEDLPKNLSTPAYTDSETSDSEMSDSEDSIADKESNYREESIDNPQDPPYGFNTSYEQARKWLGLPINYTALQAIDMTESKIEDDEDNEDFALECIQVVAEGTSNDYSAEILEQYIEYGGLPSNYSRDDLKKAIEEGTEHNPFSLPQPVPSTIFRSSPIIDRPMASGNALADLQSYSWPYRYPAAFGDVTVGSPNEPSRILDSFDAWPRSATSYNLAGADNTSSSIMRISNLVETTSSAKEPEVSQSEDVGFGDEQPVSLLRVEEIPKLSDVSSEPNVGVPDIETGLQQTTDVPDDQEQEMSTTDAVHTGQKRKLAYTDFACDEEDFAELNPVSSEPIESMPLSETVLQDAQILSQQPASHGDSAEVQTLSQTSITNTNIEQDRPPKHKRRHIVSRQRPGFVKTLATHFAAGALGAFGVVAAIVATTPLSLQEELLFGNP